MSAYVIRPMQRIDVKRVVGVHVESFQNFFLTFLGPRFLQELYTAILDDPSGIAFVCEMDREVVGFVAGTDQPYGFYVRLLKRRWWRFGLASIGPTLRRPAIIPRLLRSFQKPEEAKTEEGCGTLMSIAVTPKAQGIGAGQALVEAFLLEAAKRRLSSVNLTTDARNNDRTNRFYQRMGFTCSRSFVTPEGRWMNEYKIQISPFEGVSE